MRLGRVITRQRTFCGKGTGKLTGAVFFWKETEHIRHIHMKCDKNNNRMERLNGIIRDREVAYRGIKKMNSPLFDGFQTFYNFSKKHGGLGGDVTPSEAALIKVDGDNKWKTIIQNASLHKENSV